MIRNLLRIAGLAAAFALATGAAQAQSTTQPAGQAASSKSASKADQQFMKDAIQMDLAEVKVGKLAQQKGEADAAKKYGETLEQDHSENLQKAQALAQQIGVTPPTEPNAKQTAMYDKLQKASGSQFDRKLKQSMIMGHKEAIAKFEKESKKKGDLATFAQQTLPALRKHLRIAQSLGRAAPTTGSR